VLVWDSAALQTGSVELGRNDDSVRAVAGLPDGWVVSGGDDRRVQVWDPATRTEIAQLDCSVTAMATGPLGPGGSFLVVAHEGAGFSLWSVIGGTGVTCPCMRLAATGVAPPQTRSRSRCPNRELRPPALTGSRP